jgi:hypothetical protein
MWRYNSNGTTLVIHLRPVVAVCRLDDRCGERAWRKHNAEYLIIPFWQI